MPVTPLQRSVIAVLRSLRGPGSHFAGSLPLHFPQSSVRYSRDFDLFHDAGSELVTACERDEQTLIADGFRVERLQTVADTFRKSRVSRSGVGESVEIDWALDSAIRFFPVEPDDDLGWRLHPFDLATNKALALAGRSETRDVIDIVEWSRRFPLEAIVWAACGKDPGYNPLLLLGMMRRFARVDPQDLPLLAARAIEPTVLKAEWIEKAVAAEDAMRRLADAQPHCPMGIAFLNAIDDPGWPSDLGRPPEVQGWIVHAPTVGGCWPSVRAGR